jgi:hypothetical protein
MNDAHQNKIELVTFIAPLNRKPPTVHAVGSDTLFIEAVGWVPTVGYSNARLSPYEYVTPPTDGIYDFDFTADPPLEESGAQPTEVRARYEWSAFPQDLKGVRIHAQRNQLVQVAFSLGLMGGLMGVLGGLGQTGGLGGGLGSAPGTGMYGRGTGPTPQ